MNRKGYIIILFAVAAALIACFILGNSLKGEGKKVKVNKQGLRELCYFEDKNEVDKIFEDTGIERQISTEGISQGKYSLKCIVPDGGGAILSTWKTLPKDWTGYDFLKFDIYSEDEVPLSLFIRDSVRKGYGERYNKEGILLKVGWNKIEVSLVDIGAKINIADIVQLRVFLWQVAGKHVLYVDNMRLEKEVVEQPIPAALEKGQEIKSSAMRVWVIGDCYKVRPHNGKIFGFSDKGDYRKSNWLWDGETKTVTLYGARNEYLAFQIIMEADDRDLVNVNVVSNDLLGSSIISKSNMEFFKEHYVRVTKKSDWPQPSTGTGEYPDALIPFSIPKWGSPFSVQKGRNHAVWVDVYIPEGAKPGSYSGILTINAKALEPISLRLNLYVWDFSLPKDSHLKFWTNYYDLIHGYSLNNDEIKHKIGDYFKYLDIERRIWKFSHKHRLNALLRHAHVYPNYSYNPQKGLKVDWSEYNKRLGPYLDGSLFEDGVWPNIFLLPIFVAEGNKWPHRGNGGNPDGLFGAMCKEFAKHFKEKGWDLSSALIYLGDEPNQKGLAEIKHYARLVHEASPDFKTTVALCSVFSRKTLDELTGYIDIWLVDGGHYSTKLLTPRKKAGEWVGFYQQGEPKIGNENLDTDGLGLRTWPWIAWKYGVDVVYLYSMTEWWPVRDKGTIWTNPKNKSWSNSQGVLIYPGRYIGTDEVIGSVRMKQIRRGMQDYEYMWLARQRGKNPNLVVNSIIQKALDETTRGWGKPGEWSHDPEEWFHARVKLAKMIMGEDVKIKAVTLQKEISEKPRKIICKVDFEGGSQGGWTGGKLEENITFNHSKYALKTIPGSGRYMFLELWKSFKTTEKTKIKFSYYSEGISFLKLQCWSNDDKRNYAVEINPEHGRWNIVTRSLGDFGSDKGGELPGDTINSIHFAAPNKGGFFIIDDVVLYE